MTFDDWLAENEPEPPTGFECVGLERMRQVWNAAQAAEREMHLLTLTFQIERSAKSGTRSNAGLDSAKGD